MKNKTSRHPHPLPGCSFPPVPVQQRLAATALTVIDGVAQVFAQACTRKRERKIVRNIIQSSEECRAFVCQKSISAGALRDIQRCFLSLDAAFTTAEQSNEERLVSWAANSLVAYTMLIDVLATCPEFTLSSSYPRRQHKKAWSRLQRSLEALCLTLIAVAPEAEDVGMQTYFGLYKWHNVSFFTQEIRKSEYIH